MGVRMIIKIHDQEIECPENPKIQTIVRVLTPMQAWQLHAYQKQPKHWMGQVDIPQYCLYLGSFSWTLPNVEPENVDLYHYEGDINYSAAIVYGDKGGDYKSGWSALAMKRPDYRELMKREFKCGLLRVDDLVDLGIAALHSVRDSYDSILPAREIFRLGPEPEEDCSVELIPKFGMCWKCSRAKMLVSECAPVEIMGCKDIPADQWDRNVPQENCPLLKGAS